VRRSALGALGKFMAIRYRVPTHDRRTSFSDLPFGVILLVAVTLYANGSYLRAQPNLERRYGDSTKVGKITLSANGSPLTEGGWRRWKENHEGG